MRRYRASESLPAPAASSVPAASRYGLTLSRTRVYLLPGMLGSQLGRYAATTSRPIPWNPSCRRGRGLPPGPGLPERPDIDLLGIIAYSDPEQLKLELNRAGFDVRLWDYDWRRDISALGAALAQDIAADSASDVRVVGHSMGDCSACGRCSCWIAARPWTRHAVHRRGHISSRPVFCTASAARAVIPWCAGLLGLTG